MHPYFSSDGVFLLCVFCAISDVCYVPFFRDVVWFVTLVLLHDGLSVMVGWCALGWQLLVGICWLVSIDWRRWLTTLVGNRWLVCDCWLVCGCCLVTVGWVTFYICGCFRDLVGDR